MAKNKITFDISIHYSTVQRERNSLPIASLDSTRLSRVGNGRLIILFEEPKTYFCMETEVLDYLVQLKGVIIDFDSGKLESFTISKDYFSDRFSYAYNPRDKSLEITDENAVGGPQKIRVRYHDFRTSFLA